MAITIKNTDEKPLLARKEVEAHMVFEGKATPSNADVAKAIASELKTDEKLVVVKHIYTAFGSCEADIAAYVYDNEEALKKFEPKEKKAEKKEGEAPAEEAKPAEKPAEAPKEEKKEEAPAEKPAEEKKEKIEQSSKPPKSETLAEPKPEKKAE
jgi:ribosomal protein S24E